MGMARPIAVKPKQSYAVHSVTQTPTVYATGLLDGCIRSSVVVKSLFTSDHSDNNTILQMGNAPPKCSINTCSLVGSTDICWVPVTKKLLGPDAKMSVFLSAPSKGL